MRIEINYKEKTIKNTNNIEAKQYATKQPMGHWRNQRGNLKNTWKQRKMKTERNHENRAEMKEIETKKKKRKYQ